MKPVSLVAAMSATPASLQKFQQNLRLHNQLKEQLNKQLMKRSHSNATSLHGNITNVSVTKDSASVIRTAKTAPRHIGRPREYTPQKHTIHSHCDETNTNHDQPTQLHDKHDPTPSSHSAINETLTGLMSRYNNSYRYSYLSPQVHRPASVSDVEYARCIMDSYSQHHPVIQSNQKPSNVELKGQRHVGVSNVDYTHNVMDTYARHPPPSFPVLQSHSGMSDLEYARINNRTWHQLTTNIPQQQNTNHEQSYSCKDCLPYALEGDREPNHQGIDHSPDSHRDPFDSDSDETETSSQTSELKEERNHPEGMDDMAKSDDGYFSHCSVFINGGLTDVSLQIRASRPTNRSDSEHELIEVSSDTETKDNKENEIEPNISNTISSQQSQKLKTRKRSFVDAFLSPDACAVSGHENQTPVMTNPKHPRDLDGRTGIPANTWNSSPDSDDQSNTYLFPVEPVLFGSICSDNDVPAPSNRPTDSQSTRSPNRHDLYRVPSHHSRTFHIPQFQSYYSGNTMEERLIEPIVITPSDENGNPLKDDSYC